MFLLQKKVPKTSKLGKSQNFRGILVGLTENALRNSGVEASKKNSSQRGTDTCRKWY